MKRSVLRLLLVAHLSMLALAAVATPSSTSASEDAEPSATLTLHHNASTVTSITVSWSYHPKDDYNVTYNVTTTSAPPPSYHVEAFNLNTEVLLVGPALSVNATEYTLPDLAVDARYNVCVWSSAVAQPACALISTIPVVRDDSLIALLIALAILAIIIIIAAILWRCAIRRASPADDEDTPSEENEDDDKHGANEKSPLLAAAPPAAGTDQPPATDPANTQPPPADQQQPQSLYLFLAGHAFK